MTKEQQKQKMEFCKIYVLNRANTSASLDGNNAAKEALKAWNVLYSSIYGK